MTLDTIYSQAQLTRILEQSVVYSCACPAQVCKQLSALRGLHAYQERCINQTTTDCAVHESISRCTAKTHALMEECLTEVLQLEGWDLDTLTMPEDLQKRLLCDIESSGS